MAHTKEFVATVSDILVRNHIIPASESPRLQQLFLDSEQDSYDSFLLSEGFVDREDLLRALAEYYKVPSFDVTGYFFERMLLRKFAKDFLLRNEVIPLEVDENMIIMIAAEPEKEGLSSEIRSFVSYSIEYRAGIAQDIIDAIEEYYDKSLTEDLNEDEETHEEDEYIGFSIDTVVDADDVSAEDDIREDNE